MVRSNGLARLRLKLGSAAATLWLRRMLSRLQADVQAVDRSALTIEVPVRLRLPAQFGQRSGCASIPRTRNNSCSTPDNTKPSPHEAQRKTLSANSRLVICH